MSISRWAPLLLTAFITGFSPAPGIAAQLHQTELVTLLRDAKIVNPEYRLDVVVSDKEVTVLTKRNPKATDSDCKINAVLMGKTLMDAHIKDISRVKVLYSVEGADACDEVVVRAGDVKSFDAGSITEEQLLSSLEIERVEGESIGDATTGGKPGVNAGPFKERRLILLSRIEELKKSGTGVTPFQQRFQKLEDLAKHGNAQELNRAISDLAQRLTEQEKLKLQAQKVGAGQGVRGASLAREESSGARSQLLSREPLRSRNQGQMPIVMLSRFLIETRTKLAECQKYGISVSDLDGRLSSCQRKMERRDFNGIEGELKSICQSVEQRKNQFMQQNKGGVDFRQQHELGKDRSRAWGQ